MNYKSPFTVWFDANITQMAVSPEILKLLALAFAGGRLSVQTKPLTDEEIIELAKLTSDPYPEEFIRMVEAKIRSEG